MFRSRLVGVSLLSICFLPGCGLFWGDRPGLCYRRGVAPVEAVPVSYPIGDAGVGGCGATVIPPVPAPGPYPGPPPIVGGPAPTIPSETYPPPYSPPPRIPRAGIDEGKGKQFELEGTGRSGPVLTIPAHGARGN